MWLLVWLLALCGLSGLLTWARIASYRAIPITEDPSMCANSGPQAPGSFEDELNQFNLQQQQQQALASALTQQNVSAQYTANHSYGGVTSATGGSHTHTFTGGSYTTSGLIYATGTQYGQIPTLMPVVPNQIHWFTSPIGNEINPTGMPSIVIGFTLDELSEAKDYMEELKQAA